MTIHYRVEEDRIVIVGQSYPLKEKIKKIGGLFDAQRKVWYLPRHDSNLNSVHQLCVAEGGGALGGTTTVEPPQAVLNKIEPIPSPASKVKTPLFHEESADFLLAPKKTTDVEGLTIQQLVDKAGNYISQAFPGPVWVIGEIQNYSMKGRAIYLNLAEATNNEAHGNSLAIAANIWQNTLRILEQKYGQDKLAQIFVDGTKIRCLCVVTLYKGRGQLSLSIQDIDPIFSQGALALAREKLLKELRSKGLDQANKKIPLSACPFHVGLISADGSRAQSDFIHQLFSGKFPGHLTFVPAAAQGERVQIEIPLAVKQLEKLGCDLIVITRGGGSLADLRWYDTPEVAYAIAQCKIPIVAAVGHHDDESVAELVAFKQCKTPTAAAEFILALFQNTREELNELGFRIAHVMGRQLDFHGQMLVSLQEKIYTQSMLALGRKNDQINTFLQLFDKPFREHLQQTTAMILNCQNALEQAVVRAMSVQEQRLIALQGQLSSLDPMPWVKQGWTQLFVNQEKLKHKEQINIGDIVSARLLDANLEMVVKKIEERKGQNEPS